MRDGHAVYTATHAGWEAVLSGICFGQSSETRSGDGYPAMNHTYSITLNLSCSLHKTSDIQAARGNGFWHKAMQVKIEKVDGQIKIINKG